MYNEGISTAGDLIDLGVEHDIISKRGAFYSLGDVRLGQGRESAKLYLEQNPEVANTIDAAIRNSVGMVVNFAPKAESSVESSAFMSAEGDESDLMALAA
jgi:recombination protein RecA